MSVYSFREKVNLKIYSSKGMMLWLFARLSIVFAFLSIGTLIYYYGFPHNPTRLATELFIFRSCFVFYIINYFVRFFYTFEPALFLRETRFELVMIVLLIIDGFADLLTGTSLTHRLFLLIHIGQTINLYLLFIQIYLVAIVLLEIGKAGTTLTQIRLLPSTMFLYSFILLISFGTGMLMLPEMTSDGKGANFLEALFTSTSASCVTGLSLVDVATFFSFKGKIIIMLLIQIGGLSIISFATFFATFLQKGIGIRHQSMLQDFFSTDSLFDTKGMLKQIILLSFLIETIGAMMLYVLWDPSIHFQNVGERLFYSAFHSISAFNNAGFSLFTNGFVNSYVKYSYVLHIVIACLIFFGSLGFSSIRDIFGFKNMRERLRYPWKNFQISTRIALYVSLSLVAFGAIAFYFLEKNNSLAGQTSVESVITSIFQSVTTRTTGFNTVDIGTLSNTILVIMIFLMFIGASSGSTGGGIKTSTFALIFISAWSTIRG
ncbi:MAG: ATPase, partial [Bacteroidia bacterium]|nr:ATPase [Bacteroidia bacterium]